MSQCQNTKKLAKANQVGYWMLYNAVLYLVQSSSIKGRFVQDCLLILSKCKCSIFFIFFEL